MRMMRLGAALLGGALGAATLASALAAQESTGETYPATLRFGSGLVTIPVAWVSPRSGDVWIASSATSLPSNPGKWQLQNAVNWNTSGAIESDWFGRVALGVSLYSQNPEWGAFGRVLIADERQLSQHHGLAWMPSIAVGVRNIGPFEHEDRLLVGYDLRPNATGKYIDSVSAFAARFESTPTGYAVATKSVQLGSANVSATAGYGTGLFSDDGGLGSAYNDKGQLVKGLFFGGRIALHPLPDATLSLLGENDGWDWNAGAVANWRGMFVGVYGTELEEGRGNISKGPLFQIYNYTKINVSVGLSTNLFDVAQGAILRSRISQLEHEQTVLRTEVTQREQRIAAMQNTLQRAEHGTIELADVARRRRDLETQIKAEQDAIKRAEDRLRTIQQEREQKATRAGLPVPPSH
jgi:hypothetical protein